MKIDETAASWDRVKVSLGASSRWQWAAAGFDVLSWQTGWRPLAQDLVQVVGTELAVSGGIWHAQHTESLPLRIAFNHVGPG